MDAGLHSIQPLLTPQGLFEYRKRPHRDKGWRFAYLACLAITVAGGLYAVLSPDTLLEALSDSDYLNDPSHCPNPGLWNPELTPSGQLQQYDGDKPIQPALPPGFIWAMTGLALSCLLTSLAMAIAFIMLLQHHPMFTILLTIVTQLLVPSGIGIMAMQTGHVSLAYMSFTGAAALALCYIIYSDSVKVVARLLSVSAHALKAMSNLILVVTGIKMCLLIFSSLVVAAGALARANGEAIANPLRGHSPGKIRECVSPSGDIVTCCVWHASTWTTPYLYFASLTLAWTIMLSFEVKVFTVAGAVGQWYFTPAGAKVPGAGLKSLKHALGPSLGSLSFASAILAVLKYIRIVLNRFKKEREWDDLAVRSSLWDCCSSCVINLLQFLTRFATVYMAMTGSSFLQSGSEVVSLLKRNAMDAYGVWWLPPMVLYFTSVALSICSGFVVYIILDDPFNLNPFDYFGQIEVVVVSLAAAALCWLTLYFITTILLHIVDAVFVCYAFDRDYNLCSQPEVHEVYAHLPGAGGCPGDAYLVTHPDGTMAYAPQMNNHFNYPFQGLNHQYSAQSPCGSPMHPDRILHHHQFDSSGPAAFYGSRASRYPVVQPAGLGYGELYDAAAGSSSTGLNALGDGLRGHANPSGSIMFEATGGAAGYWYQPSTQQSRPPPGPSPLYYSPSFNAEQAHLAQEVAKGLRNEGYLVDNGTLPQPATALVPSDK